jgi:DNA-binding Xre family transcriptional regulator
MVATAALYDAVDGMAEAIRHGQARVADRLRKLLRPNDPSLGELGALMNENDELAEDILATVAILRHAEAPDVPIEIVDRLLAGEHPIRVWRAHRSLTQQALADRVGMSAAMLSEMETGKREGRLAVIRRLADALGVSVDDLVPAERPVA